MSKPSVYEAGPMAPKPALSVGLSDVVEGVIRWRLWAALGWYDVSQRFAGSFLGTLWLSVSIGVYIACFAVIGTALFGADLAEYLPFLIVGIAIWLLVSTVLLEAPTAFIQQEYIIKQLNVPLSSHVYRLLWRNLVIAAHHFIVALPVLFFLGWRPDINFALIVPGSLLLLMGLTGISFLLGVLGARFRDIQQFLTSTVQVLFFFTPIIWQPSILIERGRAYLLDVNPVFHLIQIIRGPFLGDPLTLFAWGVSASICLSLFLMGIWLFARYSKRIPYWV